MKLNTNARNASANGIVDLLDVGTTNPTGRFKIYSGTPVTSAPFTPTVGNTLLSTINLPNPSFGNAASGTSALANAVNGTVAASGTATWGVFTDRDDSPVFQVSIGTSGADINFDNVNFVAGGTATLQNFSVTQPS